MRPMLFSCLGTGLLAGLSLAQAQPTLANRFHEQYVQAQPAWIGYTVPAVPGHEQTCDYDNGHYQGVRPPGPVHLEPPDQVQIMFRIQDNHVVKIRPISGDCQLDADSVPLRWMRDVHPAESVAFLASFVTADSDHVRDGAVAAIALHADSAADEALERFAAAGGHGSANRLEYAVKTNSQHRYLVATGVCREQVAPVAGELDRAL